MAAALLSRRVLLGWMGGAAAGLVVGTEAYAKPPSKTGGVYSNTYSNTYGV